jgi:predicted Zn-dependent protease with MMP-like domain
VDPVDLDTFEALVTDALATVPDELRKGMDNVAILIDDESPPGPLFGLYEGVPLTKRRGQGGTQPDRITLYLATICSAVATPEDLARQVRLTLLHEIGHHFGMSEQHLHDLGWASTSSHNPKTRLP